MELLRWTVGIHQLASCVAPVFWGFFAAVQPPNTELKYRKERKATPESAAGSETDCILDAYLWIWLQANPGWGAIASAFINAFLGFSQENFGYVSCCCMLKTSYRTSFHLVMFTIRSLTQQNQPVLNIGISCKSILPRWWKRRWYLDRMWL